MAEGRPVDGRHPAVLLRVILHDALDPQLIRLALVVGVIAAEGEDEPFAQTKAVALQVLGGPRAGEFQPVVLVQILEVRADAGSSPRLSPRVIAAGAKYLVSRDKDLFEVPVVARGSILVTSNCVPIQ
jgi:hypothetical protein